ncbi:MAG: maltose phosphorylase, partial [Pararoseburia sp.]|nr:maltose phosphorylase [Pararoseburia sp.]
MSQLEQKLVDVMGKDIKSATNEEIYGGLLSVVQEMAAEKEVHTGKKKLYYISAEFLIGKLLSNNMINLGIYDEVRELLKENGKDICDIEEVENE